MRFFTRLIVGWLVVASVVMVAVVPAGAQDTSGGQMVAPSGPYAVGRAVYQWVDETRGEVHTPQDDSDKRELLVEVWYPAEPAQEAVYASYLDPAMVELFADMYSIQEERWQAVRSNAVEEAPLPSGEDTFPVIIFDPGFSASPRQYTILLEELASHGYVVLAPSHPYVTTLVVFPDGRLIEPLNGSKLSRLWAPRDIYEGEFSDVWVPDTTFVVAQTALLNEDDPKDIFTGRLDLEQIGMIGHSQGARTISEVCLNEPRCAGAISLDGQRSAMVEVAYDKPYMLILADNGVDAMVQEYRFGLEAATDDYYVMMIPQTHHNSFMDDAFLVPLLMDDPEQEGLEAAQYAVLAYRAFILSFFNHTLRGQEEPLLGGPTPETGFPDVFFLPREEPISPPTAGVEPEAAALGSNLGVLEVGSADVWTYTGTAGEELSLMLMADRPANEASEQQREEFGLLDTVLVVRAPDGSVLAANDDSFMGTNSAVDNLALPVDGQYVIEARSWASQTAGGYTLILKSSLEGETP